jgi:hypothetical protein
MKKFLITLDRLDTHYFDTRYVFENCVDSDTEDFDYDVHTTDGWNDNGLMSILEFRRVLDGIINEHPEATHIEIGHNLDHEEYEFIVYKITSEDFVERELTEEEKLQEEIEGLERRIKYLKNKQIQLGDIDDLPF